MDPDSKQINDLEIKILKQRSYNVSNDSHVLQSSWIRRAIQTSDGLDRFLLGYGYNFLPACGIVSWILFFIKKIS